MTTKGIAGYIYSVLDQTGLMCDGNVTGAFSVFLKLAGTLQ
jgi:hypothetical protein